MEKRVEGDEQLVCPYCNINNFTINPDCPENFIFCINCSKCVDERELKVLQIGDPQELKPDKSSEAKKSFTDFTKKARHVGMEMIADSEKPKPSYRKLILVAIGVSLLALSVGLVVYNDELNLTFDASSIPVGLTDKSYCKYLLSNGACMNEQYINRLSPQNFLTECPDGYVEEYEFSMGRYCIVDPKDRQMQHDILCHGFGGDCILIGITENFDPSKGKSYLPPDMVAELEG